MAAPMPPDDVSALMTRVELDRSQYKVFDRRPGPQLESGAPSHPAVQPVARIRSRVRPAAVAGSSAHLQEVAHPRWNVLNSLLSVENDDPASSAPEALLVPMLTFSAGPGGVGKTTILSSLARILSGMGEMPISGLRRLTVLITVAFRRTAGCARTRPHLRSSSARFR